jgi:hypothetical protein
LATTSCLELNGRRPSILRLRWQKSISMAERSGEYRAVKKHVTPKSWIILLPAEWWIRALSCYSTIRRCLVSGSERRPQSRP